MPEIDNQNVKSYREQLTDMMRSEYPDRQFADATGANGETGSDVLEQSIFETLIKFKSYQDEQQSKNKALVDLLYSDPRSAEFINAWVRTEDPRSALVETFGDELSSLATEEGRGQWSQELQGWRDRKSESDRLDAEAEANWNKSLEDLEAWGNEHNLSSEQKVQIMVKLVGIAANGLMNKYEAADFDLALKAMDFDSAVEGARHEGEVAGRNARIDENRKRRQNAGVMPPALNGQAGKAQETVKKPESIWAGIK